MSFSHHLPRVTAIMLLLVLILACAIEQTEYEKFASDYSFAERQEQLHNFVKACESAGRVMTNYGPKQKMRNPFVSMHRHARFSDYVCADMRHTLN